MLGEAVKCIELLGGNVFRTETFLAGGLEILLVARPTGGGGGGDVYCIHSCGHGALAKFVLLDLAGHGQARDTMARSVHTLLHRYSNEIRPSPLLVQLNRHYTGFVLPPIHATAVSAVYEPGTGEFRFANAGQPRPFHWSAGHRRWSVVRPATDSDCGLPLGIQSDGCYTEESFFLGEGDLLLLSSDGLPEMQNSRDEFLEPEGVLKFLEEATHKARPGSTLAELAEPFLRRVEEFRGGKQFEDDTTLLWLRRLPGGKTRDGEGELELQRRLP